LDLRILQKIMGPSMDLLLEQVGGIMLVEVKSGQTYQDELQRALQSKRAHMGWAPDDTVVISSCVYFAATSGQPNHS